MAQSVPSSDPSQQPDAQQTQAQPPTNNAPAEQHGFASELLAYQVIDNLGDIIAKRVRQKIGKTGTGKEVNLLLVTDLEQALGGMLLGEIQGQITLMEGSFERCETKNADLLDSLAEKPVEEEAAEDVTSAGAAALITAVGGITGTLTDVVTLFRSDYEITERDFDVKESAIFASIAGSLVTEGLSIFIPGFYFSRNSTILTELTDLSHQAARLQTQRDSLAALLPKPEEKDESDKAAPALSPARLAEIATAVRDTDANILFLSGCRTSWSTPLQGQTYTKLEKALIREGIETLGISHLLWLGTHSSGGDTIVTKGLLEIDRIGFKGGAAVSFKLADINGQILDGNTYAQYGVTGGKLKDYLDHNMTARFTPIYREPPEEGTVDSSSDESASP